MSASLMTLLLTSLCLSPGSRAQEAIDVELTVVENIGRNAYVGNIASAAQLDTLVPQQYQADIKFQILDRDSNQFADYLYINSVNGDVRINRAIDREELAGCAYNAMCQILIRILIVSENPDWSFLQIVQCYITIEDRNDNSPQFAHTQVTLGIAEDTPVTSRIAIQGADDRDSPQNGISHYTLISTALPQFRLAQTNQSDATVAVYIEIAEALDREDRQTYRLVIAAYDKGNKSGTLVINVNIVDVNDNEPAFSASLYEVSVAESTPLNTTIVSVSAVDMDSGQNAQILYALQPRSQSLYGHVFSMNDETGELTIIDSLDYERHQLYTLYVTAEERHHETLPVHAQLIIHVIDVNDNAPLMTLNAVTQSGNLEITENAAVATIIGLISTYDPDTGPGGKYTCTLDNNEDNAFELTATSSSRSDFKIVTNSRFDRETQSEYNLKFRCTDQGSPLQSAFIDIRITILDENDNAPHFIQQVYNVSIEENNTPGASLIQVRATDEDFGQNSELEFDVNDDARPYISIDAVSGVVSARVAFDYEQYHVLTFGLIARDRGTHAHTATAILNIHVLNMSDEPPVLQQTHYDVQLLEGEPAHTLIQVIRVQSRDTLTDTPSTILRMDEQSAFRDLFEVQAETGNIYTLRRFDADSTQAGNPQPRRRYEFYVFAIDSQLSNLRSQALVSVEIIDVNDNPPVIHFPSPLNRSLTIGSDVTSASIVASIVATDIDRDTNTNSRLTYVIECEDEGYFVCDEYSGDIRTARPLQHIDMQTFTLSVTVYDHGQPALYHNATLLIIVNASINHSGKEKTESLVENNNLTIVTTVTVISAVLILLLLVAIIILQRKDKIKLHYKQKRMVALFSCSQKAQLQNTDNVDSVHGRSAEMQESVAAAAGEYQIRTAPQTDRNHKVGPWLNAQMGVNEEAASDLLDESITSDSGRGSHEEPADLPRQLYHRDVRLEPAAAHKEHHQQHLQRQHSVPAIPPRTHKHYANTSYDSVAMLAATAHHRTATDNDYPPLPQSLAHALIQPDHKVLYRQHTSSPSHQSVHTARHNHRPAPSAHELQAFVTSASYI